MPKRETCLPGFEPSCACSLCGQSSLFRQPEGHLLIVVEFFFSFSEILVLCCLYESFIHYLLQGYSLPLRVKWRVICKSCIIIGFVFLLLSLFALVEIKPSMASPRESNSRCLKRKLVEDSLSKECKFRRVKAANGPSFDLSSKRCNCCCIRPNLANDCVNFLKSGMPKRIMYYKQGSWHNFPEQIMKFLIEEFSGNKSSVVSVMDDDPVLIDFLSMTMVNLKSRKQRSVAWIDDTSKCFSPSLFFDEEIDDMVKGDAANAQGTVQGIMLDKAVNSPPEVVKQVVVESSLPASQKPSNADILRKKIISVERGSKDFLFVQDLFLSGMAPFATPKNLLRVYRYSPNDITAQCRLQAFEKQIVSTKEKRGDANVRYGWLGSRKNDIVRILINGLGITGKPAEKSDLSAGVYLSPENRTFTRCSFLTQLS